MKAQQIAGTVLVIAGTVWSVMFPKTSDVLRPDFVASVAIGIGLIVPGVLVFKAMRSNLFMIALCTLLLWSLLANVFLVCTIRDWIRSAREQQQSALSHGR